KDLTDTVDRAGSVQRAIAKQRDNLAQVLHIGPNTLANFTNLFHPRTGELFGVVSINGYQNSLASPGNQVCALLSTAAAANEQSAQKACTDALGPLFAQLIKMNPRIQDTTLPPVDPGLGFA